MNLNRRGMFGSALGGLLGFFSKPVASPAQFVRLQPAKLMTSTFTLPKEQIAELVQSSLNTAMARMRVTLPDGSMQVFPLTQTEESGTIWNAPSTG